MKTHLLVSTLLMSVFAAACSTVPYTGRRQLDLVSDAQMEEMGEAAFQEAKTKEAIVTQPEVVSYIRCVANPLIATYRSEQGGPSNWELVVFRTEEPNAFVLPGGHIGVNAGILKVAQNDAQLAAVLGHELSHVMAGHSQERVSQQLLAQGGLSLAQAFLTGNASPTQSKLILSALGLGTQVGLLLPYSRKQESEADLIGVHLMAESGFDPQQSVVLWKNMQQMAGAEPPEFLSTHPSSSTRIHQLQAAIPRVLREDYRPAAVQTPACRRPSPQVIASALSGSRYSRR